MPLEYSDDLFCGPGSLGEVGEVGKPQIAGDAWGQGSGGWEEERVQKAGIDESSLLLEPVEYDSRLDQPSMV